MRYLFFVFFLPLSLFSILGNSLAVASQQSSSRNQNLSSRANASFYTTAHRLVQQQINLLARTEMALVEPDPNYMRVVRGQLFLQTKAIERFLKDQDINQRDICNQPGKVSSRTLPSSNSPTRHSQEESRETRSQVQIYCSLLATNGELLKLTPMVDRLLSRRGELAWVRDLPLVSGEPQSHPVLSIAPFKRPQLGSPALPFAMQSFGADSMAQTGIGRHWKTAIPNYITPMAPAIAPPPEVLKILQSAQGLLQPAKAAFPTGTEFTDPRQTVAMSDRHAFGVDVNEAKMYAQFLTQPQTGIFRVLPAQIVQQGNGLKNRLQTGIRQRYPFPSLGKTHNGFTPNLALEIVDEQFAMLNQGVDYNLMVNLGDIALGDVDAYLQKVIHPQKDFLLNYQPPQQFQELQIDRRRFLTGKLQNSNPGQSALTQLPAKLNQTYLVRSLQFKLPEAIKTGQAISVSDRLYIDRLLAMESSDVIVAFRPVSRRPDGSYTILWRVVKQLPAPQIKDLETYLQLTDK
jgi:hypothetical protein